ncbi:ATP-binding protein [Phaeacidiphilus oryzae]|nr:hypothetical protein [Phaeacidiphilus oryzae]
MRERVSALGGRLTAGALPEGGFHVIAVLPFAVPPCGGGAPPEEGSRPE